MGLAYYPITLSLFLFRIYYYPCFHCHPLPLSLSISYTFSYVYIEVLEPHSIDRVLILFLQIGARSSDRQLAITDAFIKWSPAWQHLSVHVYTDNTVALAGLQNIVLKGPANLLLRQILVQAAAFNIQLQSSWILSEDNTLANALSRFDWATVKNLYP